MDELALGNQRWLGGRESYRPSGEVIAPREYDVALVEDDATAKRFVLEHHYSGAYVAARERVGLYRRGRLVGVAVVSVPMHAKVLTNVFPGVSVDALGELGRFVLVDEVPGNGESWFLARAFELLRGRGYVGLVSFSDPQSRTTAAGEVVHAGHVGCIYQATNARYLGRGDARTLRLLPDARVFSNRAASKIRNGERGKGYAGRILERYGAPPAPEDPDERRAWMAEWVAKLTRPQRHRGNYRYSWVLNRRYRHLLEEPRDDEPAAARQRFKPQPYPKTIDRPGAA